MPESVLTEAADPHARYVEMAQLVGGLVHEIRNPLSTMTMNLDLMAEDLAGTDSPRDRRLLQKVDRVRKESRRLEAILQDFLRFARVSNLLEEARPASLNEVVEDLRDFYDPQAAVHGILIRTHLDESLPPVRLHCDLFKQALLNLFLNAQHAMPDGGELIISTRSDGEQAVLDVVDTGCGIPEDVQGRIFDAFFSTRSGGTGLGLATTRRIVEAHGGSIGLLSEPGKGSRFSIRLPIASDG
ncbi:MAG: ATP-binding protein [Isosphaeraceae bacterium]